ncbi:NADP-dependent oxidoreductase domain-containing protein [Penicillium chrysogenum]|uniref:NADP-dependent oxidoreductase domain-containing protein n=1 Tax=Penicillium chrysogenum TaxID=5076 RepID=UPI0024DF2BCF|nr:NADP-dependent oxidoreductase domain-containing protein [Penicillium chrysogenum]KAJ5227663.1 NADP-dependent oxidoreductase domain-containing protein [Penicillium chrysogenum]
MSLGRTFKLNSGHDIPAIGLGTWLSKSHEVENAVEAALRRGYRHIDAAACYLNETEVGAGWKKSGVPREQIFITSKLWNTHHHPDHVEEGLDKTLRDLQTDYLDLYLVHWPVAFEHTNETLTPIDPVTNALLIRAVYLPDRIALANSIASIAMSSTFHSEEAGVETGRTAPVASSRIPMQRAFGGSK